MELDDGAIKTSSNDKCFVIECTQESAYSCDGGYTFMDVTNTASFTVEEAKMLIDELQEFCKRSK